MQHLVTLRMTNDPTRSRNLADLQALPSPPPQYSPQVKARNTQPSPDLDYADLDMRNAMLAAGGPNYETVLHDADTQMGSDSGNIPSERCGGGARQANLKRKARYKPMSVAETFAYCTLNTVSTENAADIL